MDEETAAFLFIVIQGPEECEGAMMLMTKITYNAHLAAALLITGGDVGRRLHNERQVPTQSYLSRPQLQPNTDRSRPKDILVSVRGMYLLAWEG